MLVIEQGQLVAGRYRLVESVGSGGMGIVWRAKDERLERTVAIKQLLVRPGLSAEQTADTRRRAMREARTAARLQHRNAIALFDVAEHDGDPWLVMEFLRSRSLSTVLAERGSLPAAEVAKIGAQVASALAAAHAAGIVHRDVKPGNVLLDDEGLAKITDFGISRTLDDGTVTQTGMLAGTPAYLAPEVARGKQPGRASDVFSLGATLYHAVEGSPPFGTDGNPLALLHAVASGNVPPPRLAGSLTPALMSLLRDDPVDRPTMERAVDLLANLDTRRLDEQQTVPVRPEPAVAPPAPAPTLAPGTRTLPHRPEPPPQQPQRRPVKPRRVALIAAVVAAFALAGVITALIIGMGRDPGTQGSGPPPSSQPAPTTTTVPTTSTTAAPPPVQGPIDWSQAGQLIIDYYNGMDNLPAAWGMLAKGGQAAFGSQQAFEQYWGQFKQVSARDARGVTPNADGSVNVPVNVTYTASDGASRQEQKVLKVVIEGGRLAIDADTR